MSISLANLDVGGIFSGIGTLAKDLRTAFTGKEPLDANKAAELALKSRNLRATLNRPELASWLRRRPVRISGHQERDQDSFICFIWW